MDGVEPTAAKQIGIHAGLLISHGIVNSFGIKTLAIFNRISITLHSVGVASLAIALLASAPRLRSGREVFATFIDNTGIDAPGWSERASPAYVAVCGILLAQFTSECDTAGWLSVSSWVLCALQSLALMRPVRVRIAPAWNDELTLPSSAHMSEETHVRPDSGSVGIGVELKSL